MSNYRISRNIEASIIDQIKTELDSHFSTPTIEVEKSFARIYGMKLPSVCIRLGPTDYSWVEAGSNAVVRNPLIYVDIFGASLGQTLDIKDCLIDYVKNGFIYYNYEIENGIVKTKTQSGRIRVLRIDDVPVNFDTDKDKLDVHDRNRHLLTLTVSLGKVE